MTSLPVASVAIGFGSGVQTAPADVTWTDVTDYFEGTASISRGRSDEQASLSPARCSLTLDNRDGRFTPLLTTSPYYPSVKRGTPIKVELTPSGGASTPRFVGVIDEWALGWPDGGDATGVVTITATSGLERLRSRSLLSPPEETYLSDPHLFAYFTLGESSGTTGSDIAPSPRLGTLTVATGTVEFGSATGPGTDSMPAPAFTDGGLGSSQRIAGQLGPRMLMEATVRADVADISTAARVLSFTSVPAVVQGPAMSLLADGTLSATFAESDGTETSLASTTSVADGSTHHVALLLAEFTATGASLWVDGVKVDEADLTDPVTPSEPLRVGTTDPSSGLKFTGTISHVALTDAEWITTAADVTEIEARIADRAAALLTGFEGDSSDARLARYLDWSGGDETVTLDPGFATDLAHFDTRGSSLGQVLEVLEVTEQGTFIEKRDGTYQWLARDHRYNAASLATFSATDGAVGADLEAILGDLGLVNMVTVTDGTATVTALSTESIDQNGTYDRSLTTMYGDGESAQALGEWLVNLYGEPAPRVPTVTVDASLMPAATQQALAGLEVGDLITLTDMPAQFPWTEQDFFVEGWSESIGFDAWRITLNLSSSNAASSVWVLDSATYSQLDTTTRLAL